MPKILVMGGTSYDTIIHLEKNPVLKGTFEAQDCYGRCGSSGTAKAVALKKLGAQVTLHSILGSDETGQQILGYLAENGIPSFIDYYEGDSERHINLLDEDGNRILVCLPGKTPEPALVIDEKRLKRLIAGSDIIVLNILAHNKPYLKHLKRCAVWTDLQDYLDGDPFCNDFIEASQVIFMSSARLVDYRSTMRRLGQNGKLIIATHGRDGSTAYQDDRFYDQDAHDFTLVNSDGAGDNYFAGFLVEYLKKRSLERSLMTASIAGGLSIETRDLVPADLTYDMLERTMIERGIR